MVRTPAPNANANVRKIPGAIALIVALAVTLLHRMDKQLSCEVPRATSNRAPLHLVERELVASPGVQFCGPRRFVRRDRLGVLDGAAVHQIRSDAGGPECVAARGVPTALGSGLLPKPLAPPQP